MAHKIKRVSSSAKIMSSLKQPLREKWGLPEEPQTVLTEELKRAMMFLNGSNLAEAERICRHELTLRPTNGYALWQLGIIAMFAEQYEDALRLLQSAQSEFPHQIEKIYRLFGETLFCLGRYEESYSVLTTAEQLDPNETCIRLMGIISWMLGEREEATRYFSRLPAPEHDDPKLTECMYIASALALTGRVDDALCLVREPIWRRITSEVKRSPWYLYANLVGSSDISVQSQRFGGVSDDQPKDIFQEIADTLVFCTQDRVLDIGGAGGLFTLGIAPLVSEVVMTDVEAALVEKATQNLHEYRNVVCLVDDVVRFNPQFEGAFDKVLMCAVTQIFDSFESFRMVLGNLYRYLRPSGRILVGGNGSLQCVEEHLRYVITEFRVGERKPRIEDYFSRLHMMANVLWLEPEKFLLWAREAGFSYAEVIAHRALPHIRQETFDVLLVK